MQCKSISSSFPLALKLSVMTLGAVLLSLTSLSSFASNSVDINKLLKTDQPQTNTAVISFLDKSAAQSKSGSAVRWAGIPLPDGTGNAKPAAGCRGSEGSCQGKRRVPLVPFEGRVRAGFRSKRKAECGEGGMEAALSAREPSGGGLWWCQAGGNGLQNIWFA